MELQRCGLAGAGYVGNRGEGGFDTAGYVGSVPVVLAVSALALVVPVHGLRLGVRCGCCLVQVRAGTVYSGSLYAVVLSMFFAQCCAIRSLCCCVLYSQLFLHCVCLSLY